MGIMNKGVLTDRAGKNINKLNLERERKNEILSYLFTIFPSGYFTYTMWIGRTDMYANQIQSIHFWN